MKIDNMNQNYEMVMTAVSLVVAGKELRMPFNYCADPTANMITWVSCDLKHQVFLKNIDWNYSINQQLQQALDFMISSDQKEVLSGFWELT